jgi:hypothetical protein
MVVGQDAELECNDATLAQLGRSEHEIGNHSFHHEPWLHLKTPVDIDTEIARAHQAIVKATGKEPRGFRGPGFSLSVAALEALCRQGYSFDASTFPTFIGPLARVFYFRSSELDPGQRQERARLFGSFTEGFRPNRAYRWEVGDSSIVEMPVTTMPVLRLPIHVSYMLYIARYSERAAIAYVEASLFMCRLARVEPSILLHPLDFLGGDEVDGLGFFPGMDMKGAAKRRLVMEYLERLAARFRVLPLGEQVAILAEADMPSRVPRFA